MHTSDPTFQVGRDVSAWPSLKVTHAYGHALTLRSRVDLWAASHPMDIVARINDDRCGATWRLRVTSSAPAHEWSLLIGDCVHQLRSALDSCIWDFATRSGQVPNKPERIQFPIVRSKPEGWDAVANDRLAGVDPAVVDRVRIT